MPLTVAELSGTLSSRSCVTETRVLFQDGFFAVLEHPSPEAAINGLISAYRLGGMLSTMEVLLDGEPMVDDVANLVRSMSDAGRVFILS